MMLYDLPAPAKLNLFLHVVGRRDDGYHKLETLFRLISLSDSISIDLAINSTISRDTNLAEPLIAENDLVVRAALALQKITGTKMGAHISVNKRIPVGGGLGGGSSDAATVLIGLNRLWQCHLKRSELMQIGLSLGADVPFFIYGQSAFAQGIGEQLTPVLLAPNSYLVVQPSQSVATQSIFNAPDLTRQTESVKITDFSGCKSFVQSNPAGFGKNDLQPVVFRQYPVVFKAFARLVQLGLEARLTGSGGCLFIECSTPSEAVKTREVLRATMSGNDAQAASGEGNLISNVFACDGYAEHPLRHWVND